MFGLNPVLVEAVEIGQFADAEGLRPKFVLEGSDLASQRALSGKDVLLLLSKHQQPAGGAAECEDHEDELPEHGGGMPSRKFDQRVGIFSLCPGWS